MASNNKSSGLRVAALSRLVEEDAVESIVYLSVDDVMPDPNQPRKHFDDESIEEMAASLRENGNIVPIEVRENPGRGAPYIMNDGERRWRAAKKIAGFQLKALVYKGDVDPSEIHDRQFIANVHRDNMTIEDQAAYLQRRRDELGSVEAVADKVRLSAARIYKILGVQAITGVAAEARDEGLSRDAETLTGLQALAKRDEPAARNIVDKARESGGKISRTDVAKASREARQKTTPAKGKGKGAAPAPAPAKKGASRPDTTRQAHSQPDALAVFVRVEGADKDEAARWEALSALGDACLCLVSMAEAAGHAVVIAGGRADEFRLTSIRVERVGSRDGA